MKSGDWSARARFRGRDRGEAHSNCATAGGHYREHVIEPHHEATPGAAALQLGGGAGAMIELLVDRLFLRALQFALAGVLFGIAFFPLRGRGSSLELATAGLLLALTTAALVWRRPLLARLRGRPTLALLFPLPVLIAATLDGGFGSVWTPLVAVTVGVSATLGQPWLSLGCALCAAAGQAAAAWINRAHATRSDQILETAVFNAVGTIAAGVGIALCVSTLASFLHRRPQVLRQLREGGVPAASPEREPGQRLLCSRPADRAQPGRVEGRRAADGRACAEAGGG